MLPDLFRLLSEELLRCVGTSGLIAFHCLVEQNLLVADVAGCCGSLQLMLPSRTALLNEIIVADSNMWQPTTCDSKRFQAIPSDSKRFQAIPSDSKRFQAIPSDSKRFQAIPSDSKRFQAIFEGAFGCTFCRSKCSGHVGWPRW